MGRANGSISGRRTSNSDTACVIQNLRTGDPGGIVPARVPGPVASHRYPAYLGTLADIGQWVHTSHDRGTRHWAGPMRRSSIAPAGAEARDSSTDRRLPDPASAASAARSWLR